MVKNQTDSIAKQHLTKLKKTMDVLLESNKARKTELDTKYGEGSNTQDSKAINDIAFLNIEDEYTDSKLKAASLSSASHELVRVVVEVERYIELTDSAYVYVLSLPDEQDSDNARTIKEHREHLAEYLSAAHAFLDRLGEPTSGETETDSNLLSDSTEASSLGTEDTTSTRHFNNNQELRDDVASLTGEVRDIGTRLQQLQDTIPLALHNAMQQYVGGYNPALWIAQAPPSQGQAPGQPSPSSTLVQLPSGPNVEELFWLPDKTREDRRIKNLTEKLLRGPLDKRDDLDLLAKVTTKGLINAWEQAVKTLATSLSTSDPKQTTMSIAALFFVHKLLQEKLYNYLIVTIRKQGL
jgi:hypothetical protein